MISKKTLSFSLVFEVIRYLLSWDKTADFIYDFLIWYANHLKILWGSLYMFPSKVLNSSSVEIYSRTFMTSKMIWQRIRIHKTCHVRISSQLRSMLLEDYWWSSKSQINDISLARNETRSNPIVWKKSEAIFLTSITSSRIFFIISIEICFPHIQK